MGWMGWMGWVVIIGRRNSKSTFGADNISSPMIRFYWSNCCLISDNTKSSKLAVFLSLWPLARCLPGRWTNRIAKRFHQFGILSNLTLLFLLKLAIIQYVLLWIDGQLSYYATVTFDIVVAWTKPGHVIKFQCGQTFLLEIPNPAGNEKIWPA